MEKLDNKKEKICQISKKTFNKKKWREQKYSCKAKVQKWESFKRMQVQRQFKKECKNLPINFKPSKRHFIPDLRRSESTLKEAQFQYKALQQMKKEQQREQERIQKERIEAIKAYKEKKAARFKKICQKTRKGQPLMRGRIELLLEKIQKECVNFDN